MNFKEDSRISTPELLLFDLNIKNNLWIIKARILYSFFLLVFFFIYQILLKKNLIPFSDIILIFILAQSGNILFYLTLNSVTKKVLDPLPVGRLFSLSKLQIDFDFVLISIILFFTGGINSPVIFFFILYIVISAFILSRNKLLRNTIYAILYLTTLLFVDASFTNPQEIMKLILLDIIMIFSYFVSSFLTKGLKDNQEILEELLEKSRELSITDNLSGLYNQGYFFEQMSMILKKSKRYNTKFSLIMLDIDYFKEYNDSNGHLKGSAAIQKIGIMLGKTFRDCDICARYGGDEFVVILPDTDQLGAFLAADRFRGIIEETEFEGMESQPMKKVTLSIGISSFPEHGDSVEKIIEKSDIALYRSKADGRNMVQIFKEEETGSVGNAD